MTSLRWRDMPWARKLALLLLALAVLPTAALTVFNETAARREFIGEIRTRNLQQAQNTAVLVSRYLQDVLGDVTLLSLAPVTSRVLAGPTDARSVAELSATMESIRETKHIEMLQVLDHDGTVIASTQTGAGGRNLVSAPFFLSAIAGQSRVHEPRYQPDLKTAQISVSAPVRGANGQIAGVAMGRVSLDDLDRLVASDTNFGSLNEFGLLFDEQGIVLSSPAHPDRRFHPLAPLDPIQRGRLIVESRFGPGTAQLLDASGNAQALVERARWRLYDPAAGAHVPILLGGEQLQVTSVPVDGTRWTYAVATPEWKALAVVRDQSRRNLAAAGATALVALLVASAFAGWLARPLSRVQDAARALAAGDLSQRTGLTGRDEIGQLGAAFDAMADALAVKDAELRRHAESLERRVEERTIELRGLLHAVPDLIFKVSADGLLLDYVAAKDEDLAMPPESFLGQPLAAVLPAAYAEATLDRIRRVLAGEAVEPYEYRLPIRGTERHFEARISASGPGAVVILVRDVTHRRRNEDRTRFLARAAESLALSLDYGSTAESLARLAVPFLADICIADLIDHGQVRLGAVASVDAEAERRVVDMRSRYPLALDAQHPATVAMRAGPKLFRDCSSEAFHAYAQSPDHVALMDTLAPVSVMVLPLVARGQTLGSMMFVSTDARRHYAEADLALAGEFVDRAAIAIDNARLYRELQESNRLKDEFLGTVSHELRTPLNAVLGWTKILRKGLSDQAQVTRALDAVERNARAQAELVEDLLDTSRVVSGKLHVDLAPTAIGPVVDGSVESFGPLARARRIDLTSSCEADLPAVLADPTRLQQIVGNLVSNAVKFTPAGGRVQVAARRSAEGVEITVADTGSGIPQEFLPYVFDRFRQGDSTTTRAHGGLGLGLAIARHLVELHGGTIRAASAGEHQGAVFTVVLPAAAGHPPMGAQPAPPGVAPAMAGLSVLAVDDQDDARALLQVILSGAGADVAVAASTREALATMTIRRPDVLVADIAMPAEDGYALIRAVRQDEHLRSLPRLPAIALTAYARDDDRMRAQAAGFDRHLTKPLDEAALLTAIHELTSDAIRYD